LLVAAANPCKCGQLADPALACSRVPICGEDYIGRISGPLMDRFDLRIEVPPVSFTDLDLPASRPSSEQVKQSVTAARHIQSKRFEDHPELHSNADAHGQVLEQIAAPDQDGTAFLSRVAERFRLSARGYHRILRVARTIADLEGEPKVLKRHIAEAASFRLAELREPALA